MRHYLGITLCALSVMACASLRQMSVPASVPRQPTAVVAAEDEKTIADWVADCRRNVRSSPGDAQRSCSRALGQIRMDPFPDSYTREKREAFTLLGRAYYRTGRIEAASAHFDSVLSMPVADPEDRLTVQANEYLRKIDKYFATLRVVLRDRKVATLSYISGIDIDIEYPSKLTREQRARLGLLMDVQTQTQSEFRFVGQDELGRPYMEIKYFPLITVPFSRGYSLIVENSHRYRFRFEAGDTKPLHIGWEDGAGWRLIAYVPEDRAKLEIPASYTFATDDAQVQTMEVDGTKHVYVPVESTTVLRLTKSDERAWEQTYEILMRAAAGAAGLVALLGVR